MLLDCSTDGSLFSEQLLSDACGSTVSVWVEFRFSD